jgi:hypothetical protein
VWVRLSPGAWVSGNPGYLEIPEQTAEPPSS